MAPKAKTPAKPAQSYHFFGSNALHWATGDTREEVLADLARRSGAAWIKNSVDSGDGGLYVWTVRAETPKSTRYPIENYAPVGVPLSAVREFNLLTTKTWAEVVPDSIPADQLHTNKSRWAAEPAEGECVGVDNDGAAILYNAETKRGENSGEPPTEVEFAQLGVSHAQGR